MIHHHSICSLFLPYLSVDLKLCNGTRTLMYVIQERVGHEDSKITQQIYLHVTKGKREKLQSDLELL